jgi:predicted GNAT family acetyltransferase
VKKEFSHQADASRYALLVDGELVSTVDYAVNGGSIAFTRVWTNPAFRGRGFAAEIVEYAADDVEANSDRRIIPMCWYAGEWFDLHPDRAHLLTRAA